MILNTIFLFVLLIIVLYIYDRNITVLDNINLESFKQLLDTIFIYIDKLLNNNQEGFYNQNIEIQKKVEEIIPEAKCLKTLFKKLDEEIQNTETTHIQYHIGKQVRSEYYSKHIYNQILAVVNDDMPHHQMTYLLDIQNKVLKIIHDFIFTTCGSQIPQNLQDLETQFKNCFNDINKKLTKINNDKFIYKGEQLNNNNGFIFSDGSSPVPKNSFYDNLNYY
jgi:hypothetical protein